MITGSSQPHTLPSRSESQPHEPKLVKECVCPNARGTAKLIDNRLKMNKGQLVTRASGKKAHVAIITVGAVLFTTPNYTFWFKIL